MSDNGKRSASDRLALRVADLSIRHPWRVIGAVLLAVAVAAVGAGNLAFSNNYRVFFSEKNPELIAFDEFQKTYTKNDNLLFVIRPAGGEVFTPEVLDAVEWLTTEAWQIPFALRVDSVTNFQHSWADGDDLTVEDLVRDARTLTTDQLAAKREVALSEPLILHNLLNEQASATGVNVTLQYPEVDLTEVPAAMAHARQLRDQLMAQHDDLEVAITGVSALNNAFAEIGQQDAMTLMPIMFLVLIVFMVIALRSFLATLATLGVVGLSTVTALGLAGHLGIRLTPISATAPVIILTLAIADSVHVLISMRTLMLQGHSKHEALREAVRLNFTPIVITSVTTIVGFLTLNFSDAPPFWDLGNITAMGIAAALFYSLTLLPAALRLLPLRVRARESTQMQRTLSSRLGDLGEWVAARHRPILGVLGIGAIAIVAFVPTIDLDDEWVKYFDRRTEFRQDADFALRHLDGIYLVEYSVEAGEPEGISAPEYLAALDRFTDWLREQPEVVHVNSYADTIKRLNRNMHGDDPAWHRLPEERELAAQYLLLYELSLPFGLDLNDRINIDKSATRVTAKLTDQSTVATREFLDRSRAWVDDNLSDTMAAEPTGASVMFSYISQRNIESMLRGNALAVLIIGAIMIVALRSFKLGLLSLIPNALPILVSFGLWAILVRQVGMAAATVSASSLGIVVDDTVHFLAKYLRARREKGLEPPAAIRYAFEMVGTAIISTTVILSAGFLILSASTFRINSQLGLLTAIVIVAALLIDFFLLPAMLMVGHRASAKERTHVPVTVEA